MMMTSYLRSQQQVALVGAMARARSRQSATPPCMHVRSESKGATKQGRQLLILVGPADAGPAGPVPPPLEELQFIARVIPAHHCQ